MTKLISNFGGFAKYYCPQSSGFLLETTYGPLCIWRKIINHCRIVCSCKYSVLKNCCNQQRVFSTCNYSVLPSILYYQLAATSSEYSILASILYQPVSCTYYILYLLNIKCLTVFVLKMYFCVDALFWGNCWGNI